MSLSATTVEAAVDDAAEPKNDITSGTSQDWVGSKRDKTRSECCGSGIKEDKVQALRALFIRRSTLVPQFCARSGKCDDGALVEYAPRRLLPRIASAG